MLRPKHSPDYSKNEVQALGTMQLALDFFLYVQKLVLDKYTCSMHSHRTDFWLSAMLFFPFSCSPQWPEMWHLWYFSCSHTVPGQPSTARSWHEYNIFSFKNNFQVQPPNMTLKMCFWPRSTTCFSSMLTLMGNFVGQKKATSSITNITY